MNNFSKRTETNEIVLNNVKKDNFYFDDTKESQTKRREILETTYPQSKQ
jgi:hypothetical protein